MAIGAAHLVLSSHAALCLSNPTLSSADRYQYAISHPVPYHTIAYYTTYYTSLLTIAHHAAISLLTIAHHAAISHLTIAHPTAAFTAHLNTAAACPTAPTHRGAGHAF